MSVATLLNMNDPAFDFEHRKAHEKMLLVSGQSSTNFSLQPYWLDPTFDDTAVPAGWGNTLHAKAHQDFVGLFPAAFGGSAIATINDLALRPEANAWAQFSNFQLHYIAERVL